MISKRWLLKNQQIANLLNINYRKISSPANRSPRWIVSIMNAWSLTKVYISLYFLLSEAPDLSAIFFASVLVSDTSAQELMAPNVHDYGKVGLAGSFIRKGFSSSVKGTKDTWSAIIILVWS